MKNGGFLLLLPLWICFLPLLRSHPLQHLGRNSTELRVPGLSPQLSGEPDELLPHTPIELKAIMDLGRLFSFDASVAAAAAAAILVREDTDQEDMARKYTSRRSRPTRYRPGASAWEQLPVAIQPTR